MYRVITFLLFVLSTSAAQAQLSTRGELLDRIVAVVNEGVVLQSELDMQLDSIRRGLTAQGVALPPEPILRQQVLESLVLKRIQLQRAERLGIAVSDDELNRTLASIAERNGMTLSQLPAALALEGIDYGQYRTEARTEMIIEQLRMRDVAGRITVSRGEVEQMMERLDPGDISEYQVNHLLIAVDEDATEEDIAAAEQRAGELTARLRNGEDFGPIAVAHSDVPGVVSDGGSLGWRRANELPSQFSDEVVAMNPGEVSLPIRSASGFHIVQLQDKRGAERQLIQQRKARHILIQPTAVLSEDAARERVEELRARIVGGEDFAELAENHSDDQGTSRRGGDLGWANPGSFVPEFDGQLAQLQPGELSPPFRTQYGWHIIELVDTRVHDVTDDIRRRQAAQTVRMRKIEEESQSWLRQLRDEAYVEIRLDDSSSS